jgi:hypothetical protein
MKKNIYIYLLLIILPFLILLPYTLQYFEVGNDFELYYFTYKKYIFELLKVGHLPLWSPVEASGTSLVFNPLAQYFYIPSWIFYFICFLIGDLTKYYFLIYTIFAISIFNLGLFFYLKTLNINYKVAITTIFITGLSLKITELLRFPNALHSFAWFSWILYGINLANFELNLKKSSIIIFFSCLMLLTAGYPYYIFYAFILFTLYFLFLSITPVKKKIFDQTSAKIVSNKIFFIRSATPSLLALLISSPWLLKISQLLSITYGRNTPDINFSFGGSSNIYDQIGSWVYPPFSFAEGWFYFGSISVLIIIIAVFYNIFFNKKNYPLRYFSYFLIFLLIFSYQLSNSNDSIIFPTLWKNLDFIQNFRYWVRFSLILVPIISIVLAYSINEFLNTLSANKTQNIRISYLLISFFILIFLTQLYFIYFSDYKNIFWETWQLKRINFAEEKLPLILSFIAKLNKYLIYPIYFFVSFIILISILRFNFFKKYIKKNTNIFLCLISIITFSELFFLTNIQWAIPFGYYDKGFKEISLKPNYNELNENALFDLRLAFSNSSVSTEKSGNNRYEGNTYYRNNKRFNVNHINNWGNEYHVKLFKKYFDLNGQFKEKLDLKTQNYVKKFFGMSKESKRVFYSQSLNHTDIIRFLDDSKKSEFKDNFLFEILSYNGDELILKVQSQNNGWVSFIDTWDNNWNVSVNDKPQKLLKLFNAYKSVEIKPGISKIKFTYRPFNFNFLKN